MADHSATHAHAMHIDCAAAVSPVDFTPVRSPQAVHSLLANHHFHGRDVIEFGSRRGDGMMCFAQIARSALAIEMDPTQCADLQRRSETLTTTTGRTFTLLCTRYQAVPNFDADYFTWWMGPPLNSVALDELRLRHLAGTIRKHAVAIALFDQQDASDLKSWQALRNLSHWSVEVEFDERNLTRKLAARKPWFLPRANGTFRVAGFRVRDLPMNVRDLDFGAEKLRRAADNNTHGLAQKHELNHLTRLERDVGRSRAIRRRRT